MKHLVQLRICSFVITILSASLSSGPVAVKAMAAPVLISGVNEPDEMRVEPFPLTIDLTPPERMLGDAMKSGGNNKPAALLPALNQILAKHPDFTDGYVMRLGALCEGNDLIAI
jgi:hypothetical protein